MLRVLRLQSLILVLVASTQPILLAQRTTDASRPGGIRQAYLDSGRRGSGDTIRLADVERLQLSLRREEGVEIKPGAYGVEVESVALVFGHQPGK